jgi:hypothetical protein
LLNAENPETKFFDLMDIFQAVMWINVNKYRTLVHLNAMNKKFAFTAVRKGRRKMG